MRPGSGRAPLGGSIDRWPGAFPDRRPDGGPMRIGCARRCTATERRPLAIEVDRTASASKSLASDHGARARACRIEWRELRGRVMSRALRDTGSQGPSAGTRSHALHFTSYARVRKAVVLAEHSHGSARRHAAFTCHRPSSVRHRPAPRSLTQSPRASTPARHARPHECVTRRHALASVSPVLPDQRRAPRDPSRAPVIGSPVADVCPHAVTHSGPPVVARHPALVTPIESMGAHRWFLACSEYFDVLRSPSRAR